ncbi:MAG: AraC family transcriptional regulator [Clostridia bacterium]|nr:AraC family transcriptional regulator [Clostridia bacterium]
MIYHLKSTEYISEQNGCGCSYFRGPDNKCLLHNHEFFEFVLTVSENVIHEINNRQIKLEKYSLMLIRPDDTHRFVDIGQGEFSYLNLAFTKETFDDISIYLHAKDAMQKLETQSEPPISLLSEKQGQSLMNQFFYLMGDSLIPEPHIYSRGIISNLFSKYFLNNFDNKGNMDLPQWLSILCSEMHKIENFSLGTDAMLSLSGKSYGHLSRCFKNYFGTTPTEYVNDIRLKYARNMILHTNMTVLDIGLECGYENIGYFHRLFKNKYGTSPGELRKHTNINPVM